MKRLILLTALFLITYRIAIGQSLINYEAGTGIQIDAGADVCADQILINGAFNGEGTICGSMNNFLSVTVFIQGFYDSFTDSMIPDTISIYLRNAVTPFAKIDSSSGLLNDSGHAILIFNNVIIGTPYYIHIEHRNSLETWSDSAYIFTGNTLEFDFTTSISKAFGNNMAQINASPLRYGIYGGDVNRDGTVDATDVALIDNDAANFVGGYVVSDLTGDDFVDGTDFAIADNNAANFVNVIRP